MELSVCERVPHKSSELAVTRRPIRSLVQRTACVSGCVGGVGGGGVALLEPAIALALSASAEYPLRSVTSGGGAGVRVVLGCNRRKEPKKQGRVARSWRY